VREELLFFTRGADWKGQAMPFTSHQCWLPWCRPELAAQQHLQEGGMWVRSSSAVAPWLSSTLLEGVLRAKEPQQRCVAPSASEPSGQSHCTPVTCMALTVSDCQV